MQYKSISALENSQPQCTFISTKSNEFSIGSINLQQQKKYIVKNQQAANG